VVNEVLPIGACAAGFFKRRRANAGFLKTSRVVWAADEKANALNGGPKTGSEFVHAARKRPKSDQANDPHGSYGTSLCSFQGG
jgi:hypothetical protein